MTGRFAQDRHRPQGEWVQASVVEEVAGVQFRKADAKAFADSAKSAEKKKRYYGVLLQHEPDNPHDRNAIAVFGLAEVKSLFRIDLRKWHIGYLPADLAAELCRELLNRGVPIAAELYSIYEGRQGFLDFKFIVLAPPFNSLSKRTRLRSKET